MIIVDDLVSRTLFLGMHFVFVLVESFLFIQISRSPVFVTYCNVLFTAHNITLIMHWHKSSESKQTTKVLEWDKPPQHVSLTPTWLLTVYSNVKICSLNDF